MWQSSERWSPFGRGGTANASSDPKPSEPENSAGRNNALDIIGGIPFDARVAARAPNAGRCGLQRGGNLNPFPPGDHRSRQILLVNEAREHNAADVKDDKEQRDIRDGLMHLFA